MNPTPTHLQALSLSADQIEAETGFTTNSWFVGSLLGGVYRLSIWRQPQHWLRIVGIELIMLALMGMLSVPMGLITLRESSPNQTRRFLQVTTTATTLMFSGWHLYLWRRTHTLRTFLQLLEDIDQYNRLVETVTLLEALADTHPPDLIQDQTSLVKALQVSRTSLVIALQLDQLFRHHRHLLHRHLWLELDQALINLHALELQEQAREEQHLIHQALQISMHVYTTIQQLAVPLPPGR